MKFSGSAFPKSLPTSTDQDRHNVKPRIYSRAKVICWLLLSTAGALNAGAAAWADQSQASEQVPLGAMLATPAVGGLTKPTTRIEMLRNVQSLFTRHQLKDNGLYTAENLERILGGTRDDWTWVANTSWQPSGEDPAIKSIWRGSCVVGGVKFTFTRIMGADGVPDSTDLRLDFIDDSGVSYEAAKNVFSADGREFRISEYVFGSQQPTQPHGNERLHILDDRVGDSIIGGKLNFSASASLLSAQLHQEY